MLYFIEGFFSSLKCARKFLFCVTKCYCKMVPFSENIFSNWLHGLVVGSNDNNHCFVCLHMNSKGIYMKQSKHIQQYGIGCIFKYLALINQFTHICCAFGKLQEWKEEKAARNKVHEYVWNKQQFEDVWANKTDYLLGNYKYNPYLLIYVCYPCICKYVRIKICLNQL